MASTQIMYPNNNNTTQPMNVENVPKSNQHIIRAVSNDDCDKGFLILQDTDVVSGRGGLANKHPGNILFRRLVNENKGAYLKCAGKTHKYFLARSIIAAIEEVGGRFLRPAGESKSAGLQQWVRISRQQAVTKTAQALREHDGKSGSTKSSETVERVIEKKRLQKQEQQKQGMQKQEQVEEERPKEPTPQLYQAAVSQTPSSTQDNEDVKIDIMPYTLQQLSADYWASEAEPDFDILFRADAGVPLDRAEVSDHSSKTSITRPSTIQHREPSVDLNMLFADVGLMLNRDQIFSLENSTDYASEETKEKKTNFIPRPSMIQKREQSVLQPHESDESTLMDKDALGHLCSLFK